MIPVEQLRLTFFAFLAALAVAGFLAGPILKALIALKSRQTIYDLAPESHQKKQGTPTMGGLVILAGAFASLLINGSHWQLVLWLAGFALIGFSDDFIVPKLVKGKRGLGWKQKIVAQVLLAVLATPVFHLPWTPLPVALTAFIVLFFCNAYNFVDGLDGLAGTVGLLLCFGLVMLGAVSRDNSQFVLLAAIAGGFVPFLFVNAPPAKFFMGDVGSLPIGAAFGAVVSTMIIQPASSSLVINTGMVLPLIILSFIMIAELLPVPMQVGFYKLTKKRLFPMTPIHHSFEVKGWPESRVVWSFFLAQLTLSVLAIGLAVQPLASSANVTTSESRVVGMLPRGQR